MSKIDFDEWLSENGPESDEEAYDLYNSIKHGSGYGLYKVKPNGNVTSISK